MRREMTVVSMPDVKQEAAVRVTEQEREPAFSMTYGENGDRAGGAHAEASTGSGEASSAQPLVPGPNGLLVQTTDHGDHELNPIKLPEIMSCLRIRQMTPFGNMHVKVSVDPVSLTTVLP